MPNYKVVILDAGGVLHHDSEFADFNQESLHKLTGLSAQELKQLQDHTQINTGKVSLHEVFKKMSNDSKTEPKPTVEQLLEEYKNNICLYHGSEEMIRELYRAGYQVVIVTNNSDVGVQHTRELLAEAGLTHVPVYGSAELKCQKPGSNIFKIVCKKEKVDPTECYFIDDREENRTTANRLGMRDIAFDRPKNQAEAAKKINACRDKLVQLGIVRRNEVEVPEGLNFGKYPSLFGLNENGEIIQYNPKTKKYSTLDQPNADGNQEKHCLYQTKLAQLIIEQGRKYWAPGYHRINHLFLADFDIKAKNFNKYQVYFDHIEEVLKKEGVLSNKEKKHNVDEIRTSLQRLFSNNFDLTTLSQFYYGVWLLDYGPEALHPFIFLTDELKKATTPSETKDDSTNLNQILILKLYQDMAHHSDHFASAYFAYQSWLTCGPPQLRGRTKRENISSPQSTTKGIIRDDAYETKQYQMEEHFAAKNFFVPVWSHSVTQDIKVQGGAMIGGSSGTTGRNVLMLAPLVESGLLSKKELMQYIMGFFADLIYRGHHSYEEIAAIADQILGPLKPWLDPIRDPIAYYEQLLMPEFLESDVYKEFAKVHANFFFEPKTSGLEPAIKLELNP